MKFEMQGSNDRINWVKINWYDPSIMRFFRIAEIADGAQGTPPCLDPTNGVRWRCDVEGCDEPCARGNDHWLDCLIGSAEFYCACAKHAAPSRRDCRNCGEGVMFDEDGCCAQCGCDTVLASAARRADGEENVRTENGHYTTF